MYICLWHAFDGYNFLVCVYLYYIYIYICIYICICVSIYSRIYIHIYMYMGIQYWVLCVDPTACSTKTFGAVGCGTCKWRGGVLAADGCIYCVPDSADAVLCIDPATCSVSSFGELGPSDFKWSGGVIAGDESISPTAGPQGG